MAQDSGLGVFLPSETAYKDPNQFRDVLFAEGSKRANYLSSMDQYYAQLDETKREFGLTLEFKREELTAQKDYWTESLAVSREKIGSDESKWRAELDALRDWRNETSAIDKRAIEESKALQPYFLKQFSQPFDPFSTKSVDTSAAAPWSSPSGGTAIPPEEARGTSFPSNRASSMSEFLSNPGSSSYYSPTF